MKKGVFLFLILSMSLLQPLFVTGMTSSDAKQLWYEAREASRDAQDEHRNVKIDYAANKTLENEQRVIDTGKRVLHAALNEVEAWLIWREIDVKENPEIPDDLKESIALDVESNLDRIEELRTEVDGIESRFELGLVFLKMIGKYLELLTDVARNTGLIWVYIAENITSTVEEYEDKLRDVAESINDNEEILGMLDSAGSEIETAKANIANA